MQEESTPGGRQINAGEANRLAQELNRQVNPDIPEYSPQGVPGMDSADREEAPTDSDLSNRQDSTWPPPVDHTETIGGDGEEHSAFREEQQR